jgi:hypothetical protein
MIIYLISLIAEERKKRRLEILQKHNETAKTETTSNLVPITSSSSSSSSSSISKDYQEGSSDQVNASEIVKNEMVREKEALAVEEKK